VTIGVDEVLIFGHGSAAGCGLGKKAEFGPPNNNYEQSCEENGRDCADSQPSRFVHWVLPLYICARTLTLLVEDWKRPFSLHERSWIQMIRERKWVFTARFIVAFAVLLAGSGTSVAQEKRVIKLPGTESLPFSDGVIAGNTLYVAGQEGTDDKGRSEEHTSELQSQSNLVCR